MTNAHTASTTYRRHQLLSLVAAVLVGSGAGATALAHGAVPAPYSPGTPPRLPLAASAVTSAAEAPVLPEDVVPIRLRVPSIGLNVPLVSVPLDEAGELSVPEDSSTAGWYAQGPRPGERGPATIVGHVDSYKGPAVFYRLRDLAPEDRAVVDYADGPSVEFTVYHRSEHEKDAFPTATVYANTPTAELRLITCGGVFDRVSRRYASNVIVWARSA